MRVKAIEYDLEHQPGFILFEFKDAKDKIWRFSEKLPVVGLPYPNDPSNIPFTFEVPSRILESDIESNGKEILRIEFLHDIISNYGENEFEVFAKDYCI